MIGVSTRRTGRTVRVKDSDLIAKVEETDGQTAKDDGEVKP